MTAGGDMPREIKINNRKGKTMGAALAASAQLMGGRMLFLGESGGHTVMTEWAA